MAVKAGYKQTEIGVIPEDWKLVQLSEIGECLIGLTYSPQQVRSSGTLVLRSSNIQNDKLNFKDNVFVDAEIPDRIMAREGDILICVRNGSRNLIGKAALLDKRTSGMTFGAFMSVFRSEIGGYLIHLLQSEIVKRQISEHLGATINQITNASLNSFRAPIPPLPEQQAIAQALSDVDQLIASLDQLIEKRSALKTATMQQLLTGKTRLKGFGGDNRNRYQATEVGLIPEDWQVLQVRQLGEVVTGGTPSTSIADYWGSDHPWITPTDINKQRDMTSSIRMLSDKGLRTVRQLPANSILVTCIASIGKNAILRKLGACNQQINAVIPNKDQSVEFLYYLFEAGKATLLSNAGMTATSIVSKSVFKKIKFAIPSLTEQIRISEVLSDVDAELADLEQRRDKTIALKQGMMQELLTGRTRLI